MTGFWKVCSFLCTQYLVGPPFAWITASMRRGMKAIILWHCSGVMEAQVALIAAFSSSALLGLVSHLSTVTPWSLNQLLVPLAVWAGAKSCWKNEISKRKQGSAIKFPGRWLHWLWTSENSGPTPADDMAVGSNRVRLQTALALSALVFSALAHSDASASDVTCSLLNFLFCCNIQGPAVL